MISANRHIKTQSGNVLFIILIAVVLFAALSFVTSTMMRGGANIGREKAGIYVSEILTYSRSLSESVRFIRISNECAVEDVSFERSPFDGSDTDYVNGSAPSDYSCHVFHPDGGGVAYSEMHPEIFDSAYSGSPNYEQWIISGSAKVIGLGSDSAGELILALPYLKKSVCEILAKRLEQSIPIPIDGVGGIDLTKFVGSYASTSTYDFVDNMMVGCINVTSGGDPRSYTFFSVLIRR
ncbi:MAG: hypothetical protein COA45_10420 [Zetaproteobacteria bacterium]|nr:MAG: hypothetical protein COA45_10420 [Zetaproteobacteria bacterium]